MRRVKRIEIVVDYLECGRVLKELADAGFKRFTLIREATGAGTRGERHGDDLRGEFTNSYILIVCPPDQVNAVIDAVQPTLSQVGGMCVVSDAEWINH